MKIKEDVKKELEAVLHKESSIIILAQSSMTVIENFPGVKWSGEDKILVESWKATLRRLQREMEDMADGL